MIDNKILVKNGFIRKKEQINEKDPYFETRWYYGPYIHLIKGDKKYILKAPFENGKYIIPVEYYDANSINVESIIKRCIEWYTNYNKKIIYQIACLEKKREEIKNYIS